MKRLVCAAAVLVIALAPAGAQAAALDTVRESVLFGTGAVGWLGARLVLGSLDLEPVTLSDPAAVNAFDRAALLPYDDGMATVSDVGQVAAMGLPYLCAFFLPASERLPAWVVSLESQVLALAAKDLVKVAVRRVRPYGYLAGAPAAMLADDDARLSFPSGHTTLAFASAATASAWVVWSGVTPAVKWAAAVGANTLAAAVGVSRVLAGEHFVTDVLAGAALGYAIGWGNAVLHRAGRGGGTSVTLTPGGFIVAVRF